MSFSYDFHPAAEEELFEAIDYLDNQRVGYGGLLAEAVVESLEQIIAKPEIFPKVDSKSGIRKASVVKPFHKTYSIYYNFQNDKILIVSFFNNRRDPQNWQNRSG